MKILLSILTIAFLTGCTASPQVKVNDPNSQAKSNSIVLNINNDVDLVAFDIQSSLMDLGIKADAPASQSQTTSKDGVTTTRDNVTTSSAPYELMVVYRRGGFPYKIKWRAALLDRQTGRAISTYKYTYNAGYQNLGWDNEEIIADMIEKLIKPFWNI